MSSTVYDILIVGAGPIGLSTALHARRRGLRALVVDKGVVANHLLDFPIGMSFFTPRHSLELLGIPLDSEHQHATREQIISYYGRVARLAELEIHDDRRFDRVEGTRGDLTAITSTSDGRVVAYRCRNLVIATGVFGTPRRLPDIPGAQHAKVSYLYRDPYRYIGKEVLLVGAGNGSAGAALALYQAGARVTVIDRNAAIPAAKWRWHLQDLQQLVRTGEIKLLRRTTLARIDDRFVTVVADGSEHQLANDAVIAMLGYEPDARLFEALGVELDPISRRPSIDVRTLETKLPGVYLAGIVCAGISPDKIFVWGARHHPKAILNHIAGEPPPGGLADLGDTIQHWAQFEKLDDEVDEELVLRMVPIVTGEIRDDFFDVYGWATRSENLYAETPARAEQAADATVGPILSALEGWLFQRNADGSVIYKGQRLSENAFEILRLCDGSRRISGIVSELAIMYEQPEDEVRGPVLKLILSLLRTGKLGWRTTPSPSPM